MLKAWAHTEPWCLFDSRELEGSALEMEEVIHYKTRVCGLYALIAPDPFCWVIQGSILSLAVSSQHGRHFPTNGPMLWMQEFGGCGQNEM